MPGDICLPGLLISVSAGWWFGFCPLSGLSLPCLITIIISPIAYILLTIGIGLSLLLQPSGFIILGAGILLTILMHWIIDPKLKTISADYEERQKKYLAELEKTTRWEDHNG